MSDEIKLDDVLSLRDQMLAAIGRVKAEFVDKFAPHAATLCACEQFITDNLAQLGPEAVLARKFAIEDSLAALSDPLKEVAAALNIAQRACETFVHSHLTSKNLQSIKLGTGEQSFLQNGTSCTVFDWESVLDSVVRVVTPPDGFTQDQWNLLLTYIRAQGNWQLLKKDVSKTAVKEIVDAKGVPPDGVKFERFKTAQFRRGKA